MTGAASLALMALIVIAMCMITVAVLVLTVGSFDTAAILRTTIRTLRRRAGTCLKCRPGSAEEQQKTQQDEKNSV